MPTSECGNTSRQNWNSGYRKADHIQRNADHALINDFDFWGTTCEVRAIPTERLRLSIPPEKERELKAKV